MPEKVFAQKRRKKFIAAFRILAFRAAVDKEIGAGLCGRGGKYRRLVFFGRVKSRNLVFKPASQSWFFLRRTALRQ